MRKTKILMNKPVYLGLSILKLSKIVIYEFWYDYVKLKYGEKAKLCYMDTGSFIVYIKKMIFIFTLQKMLRQVLILQIMNLTDHQREEKIKKVIRVMKDELGGRIMKEFLGLRARTYSYLIDDGSQDKNVKGEKQCVIKRKLKFEDDKNCLEATQLQNKIIHLEKNETDVDSLKRDNKEFIKNNKLILKAQQRFQSEGHNVFTEEINKTALSSNDDKRMQTIDLIETYAYGTSKDLVSKKEEIKCNYIIEQYKHD